MFYSQYWYWWLVLPCIIVFIHAFCMCGYMNVQYLVDLCNLILLEFSIWVWLINWRSWYLQICDICNSGMYVFGSGEMWEGKLREFLINIPHHFVICPFSLPHLPLSSQTMNNVFLKPHLALHIQIYYRLFSFIIYLNNHTTQRSTPATDPPPLLWSCLKNISFNV